MHDIKERYWGTLGRPNSPANRARDWAKRLAVGFLLIGASGCNIHPSGNQYRDTGWFELLFVSMLCLFVLMNIRRASGKDLYIRRIPGLNAIDEAIGRATEMGKPVLMVPGLSDNLDAIAVQALNIFAYVTRLAVRFGNPILLCCYNAAVYTVAQEMIRDVYQQEGVPEKFDQDSVRFVSDRQFAFAAGVSGLILREQTAATFFMGQFYAESLIFAETANSIGAIQVASSTEKTQTPFFIAACDYVLIGDEFYAASAYLTRQPVLVGSLIGQDWCKIAIIATVLFGTLFGSYQIGLGRHNQIKEEKKDGSFVDTTDASGNKAERGVMINDTFMSLLLNSHPDPDPDIGDPRQTYPASDLPTSGAGGGK